MGKNIASDAESISYHSQAKGSFALWQLKKQASIFSRVNFTRKFKISPINKPRDSDHPSDL
jgi:hypothetical protein